MSIVNDMRAALFGNPPMAGFKPSQEAVLAAFTDLVSALDLVATSAAAEGAVIYETKALLDADLAHAAGSVGLVYDDDDDTGLYIKVGSSGTGSWVVTGLLARGADGADGADGVDGATGPIGATGPDGEPGYKVFTTYAAAVAALGTMEANEAVIVIGDSGTHTDPVVGGTVSNSGRFARRAGGLERIDDYTATAQKFTIATVPPASPTSGTTQTGIQFDSYNRDESGSPSSVRFGLGFSYNPYAANSQGAGQALYTNNTFGLGWNVNAAYSLIDSTKGGPSFRIEHRFKVLTKNPSNVGGWTDGSEFHHSQRTTDNTEYRPITIYAPFTNAQWVWDSSIGFTSADFVFYDGNKTPHMQFAWGGSSSADKPIFLSAPVRFYYAGNNVGFMLQRNAANTAYLPLPYLNAQNYVQSEQPIYVVSAAVNSPLGRKTLLTLQGTSGWTDGSRAVDVAITSPVAGWMTGYAASAEAATRLEGFYVENTHASGHCGGRIVANGNTYLDFYRTTGDKKWGMGLRSDDTFAIGQQDNGVAISDAIRINYTTLQTTFMKAPKLPSATVAGAGSAATAGAGALHYVTDLNATTAGSTAAGGGSNKGVIVSDGSNWKIMVAWA